MSEEIHIREGGSFDRALRDYLSAWGDRSGVIAEIWALPAEEIPDRQARAVYATLVEALANVERHSGATHVSIAITIGPRGLRMTVSDNGSGFDLDRASRAGGRGIAAMRAHFAAVGGVLTINSVAGGGTTVSGVIPAGRAPRRRGPVRGG